MDTNQLFDANTQKGRAEIALKLMLGVLTTDYLQYLSTSEAARVVASLAADLAATGAGSSAVQVGKDIAQLSAEMSEQATACFRTLSRMGLN